MFDLTDISLDDPASCSLDLVQPISPGILPLLHRSPLISGDSSITLNPKETIQIELFSIFAGDMPTG